MNSLGTRSAAVRRAGSSYPKGSGMDHGLACCWVSQEWNVPFIIDPPARDHASDDQGPAGPTSRK